MDLAVLKRIAVILALALITILLQSSALHFLFPFSIIPNLVFLIAVALSLYEVSTVGAVTVFGIGLLFDLCSGVLIGPSAGAFVFIFGVLAVLSSRMFVDSWLPMMITTFIASLGASTVFGLFVFQFTPVINRGIGAIVMEAFLTALIAPVVLPILRSIIVKAERTNNSRQSKRKHRLLNS